MQSAALRIGEEDEELLASQVRSTSGLFLARLCGDKIVGNYTRKFCFEVNLLTRLRFIHGVESEIPDDFNMARTCEMVVSLVITPFGMAVCRRITPSGAVSFGSSIFISRKNKKHVSA